MNPTIPSTLPTSPAPAAPLAAAPPATAEARIAHLFRAARREGRIHPLQHLIQRYRAEAGRAEGSA